MKFHLLIIIAFLLIIPKINFGEKLNANFGYAKFYSKESGPYIETYLSVFGRTAKYIKNENGKFQASIEITMIFKKEDKVISFSKNNVLSPEISDTSEKHPNFIDLQRFSLPNGIYNFELSIKDLNSKDEKYKYFDIIQIDFNNDSINCSSVQFVESYSVSKKENKLSRNGFDIVPYVSNFYPSNLNSLKFYCEIYNSNKIVNDTNELLVKYYIQDYNTRKTLGDYSRYKKITVSNINVIFAEFAIDKLPSGNYTLNIDVINNKNKILANQSAFFQRSNKIMDKIYANPTIVIDDDSTFAQSITNQDTLIDNIKCLLPIADINEQNYINNLLVKNDMKMMQHFFYNFWLKRSPSSPESSWQYYKKQVDIVDKLYSNKVFKGYETDRGRVFLKYGAPNNVIASKHEPAAFPYEIWHYYHLGDGIDQQNNVKFVFYNPDLVGDYQLLHSTAKGEVYDAQWERRLSKRNNTLYNFDSTNSDPQYGSHAEENFNK